MGTLLFTVLSDITDDTASCVDADALLNAHDALVRGTGRDEAPPGPPFGSPRDDRTFPFSTVVESLEVPSTFGEGWNDVSGTRGATSRDRLSKRPSPSPPPVRPSVTPCGCV